MNYPFKKIETKWQSFWDTEKIFTTDLDNQDKKKLYLLDMFPYPSGNGLHVGHPKGYLATDILARTKIMQGFNVFHPIGWDAFGLPAEQYALNTGNNPATFTEENINNFRKQMKKIGFTFDYTKEVNTTDPKYYRWTQWIFIQLFNNGLATLKDTEVNFCEELGTVLANEEIINVNGAMVSERGNFPVIKKPMKQWVLKITHYADKLLAGLDALDWPNSVKEIQKHWIGKSTGVELSFKVEGTEKIIKVFTTKVSALFGVTFLTLSPEHPDTINFTTKDNQVAINNYIKESKRKTDLMRQTEDTLKSGVFTGMYALHPFTNEKIPIWIGDYVLPGYGTGVVMGVPSCDHRDNLFAKNHGIAIKIIHEQKDGVCLEDNGYINSDFLNGKQAQEASSLMTAKIEAKGIGQNKTYYKLRDWLFSRQRYWGEPFPLVYWEDNTITAIDENELPLILPELKDIKPKKDGQAPLSKADAKWLNVTRKDGIKGIREVNTMPQWAGSCWYYLAYLLREDDEYLDLSSAKAQERFKNWLPVDLYVGGQEHAVLHLLYARFWHLVLFDLKLVPTPEPFQKLLNQGMIIGENHEKMSKSRGNVVNPDDVIKQYGADTLRVYEMFMGPITASLPWQENGLIGISRFLGRVYRLFTEEQYTKKITKTNDNKFDHLFNKTVAGVTKDIEHCDYNTAITKLMIFINDCYKAETIYDPYLTDFLKLLNPFAPHIAEELWQLHTKAETSIVKASWPTFDPKQLIDKEVTIAIQVNGKTKLTILLKADLSENELFEILDKEEKVKKILENQKIKKQIYVKNKIVNYILEK